MYVCAFFDGAKRAHDRMSRFPEQNACKQIMERHVFFFQSALQEFCLHDPYVKRRARNEERTKRLARMAVLFGRCMVLQSYAGVCSVAPLQ